MTDDEHAAHLWAMPARDRMAMLICSIVQSRRETKAILTGALGLCAHVSRYLGQNDRIAFAESLRDCADNIEHVGRPTTVN